MLETLDHVQLAMPEGGEPEAREYYGRLLGLAEVPKPPELARRGGVWFALADGRQLHLGVEQRFQPAKKAHPCFVTSHLEALGGRLTEAGYQVELDDLNPPTRRFFTHDVFGNRLEVMERRE
jgi:hypothetical protein